MLFDDRRASRARMPPPPVGAHSHPRDHGQQIFFIGPAEFNYSIFVIKVLDLPPRYVITSKSPISRADTGA
jgi:hypothetical protein